MNFCPTCSAPVTLRKPPGDDRPRFVCDACAGIFYENPKVVTGCVAQWQDSRVLLCRRAIEPRKGFWTLPAGYLENGETAAEGASRETLEEANARVDTGHLLCVLNLPRINQIYVIFLAELLDLDFSAGEESLEVKLFEEDDIPWADLAFPSIEKALELFFADRRAGGFSTHVCDIRLRPGERRDRADVAAKPGV